MVREKQKYRPRKAPPAVQGIISLVLTGISFVLVIAVIFISFARQGEIAVYGGTVALIATILSLFGFSYGLKGCREEDKNHVPAIWGTALNAVFFIMMIAVFGTGMYA